MGQHQILEGAIQELIDFPLFRGFSSNFIHSLCHDGTVTINKHREALFNHGDPATHFGIVLSGAYKLSRVSHLGEDSVIYFAAPGDVLAALVMPLPDPTFPVTIRAMGPSRALLLRREVYLKSWLTSPELIARVQGLLSTRMIRFQSQKVMQRAPLPSKVAALLLQLVAKQSDNSEMSVPLPLTRKEIADSLGVTVESVIRVMSEWAKMGLLTTTDQHIRILKPEILIEQVDLSNT